ncbi:MAG: ComF family protein [Candidatus Omnitrophota bacterium]|nr:MAG: ComF family protein [Candidatus Omnitrophota bacterium]
MQKEKWRRRLSSLLKTLREVVYPPICVLCRRRVKEEDNFLCPECYQKIERNKPPFCIKCGCSLANKRTSTYICAPCQKRVFYFERAWAVSRYEETIRNLLHLFKYRRQEYLAKPLGKLMAEFVKNNLNWKEIDYLVPVPLHPKKLRYREFNQTELLAREISHLLHLPLIDPLMRIKSTPSQTTLPEEKRFSNIANAFALRSNQFLSQKFILIIDDVFTTGATANECAQVLKKAGAKRVEILTLAR